MGPSALSHCASFARILRLKVGGLDEHRFLGGREGDGPSTLLLIKAHKAPYTAVERRPCLERVKANELARL